MSGDSIRVGDLGSARSGDKGNHANIGIVAKNAAAYAFLQESLTIEIVRDFFRSLQPTRVERFELPRVGALNFVLRDVLAGGASQSLRLDTQGKLLGAAVSELRLPIDSARRQILQAEGHVENKLERDHGTTC